MLPIGEPSQVSTITTSTTAASTANQPIIIDGMAKNAWLARPGTPSTDSPSNTNNNNTNGNSCCNPQRLKTCREIRQMRMFKAVLALMIIFLVCRMPTWIYLLVKLYRVSSSNMMWMLHFSLGMLSVMSCVLNPFLYTFLMETIQYSNRFLDFVKRILCFFRYPTGKGRSEWR